MSLIDNQGEVPEEMANREGSELSVVANWLVEEPQEIAMEDDHRPFWLSMISKMREISLETADVLDFGCNRGGFLPTLHSVKPFRYGLGIDIAEEPIKFAQSRQQPLPIEYQLCNSLESLDRKFDLAFSYEVVYLVPDLQEHADSVFETLREGGVYYCATGCHTDYPGWQRCKDELLKCSTINPGDYSLSDYREAFSRAGFEVSACRLQFDSFVRVDQYPEYFPRVEDSLDYFEKYVVIFRCEKPVPKEN